MPRNQGTEERTACQDAKKKQAVANNTGTVIRQVEKETYAISTISKRGQSRGADGPEVL